VECFRSFAQYATYIVK